MKREKGSSGKDSIKKINILPPGGEAPKSLFVLLLLIYFISNVMMSRIARLDFNLLMFGNRIPITAFTGCFSAVANMCIIFMVVFFRKWGFFTSFVLLLMQFPILIYNFFEQHIITGIPGIFTNFLTIVMIILIFRRNRMIDKYQEARLEALNEKEITSRRLFEQTATALVNAVDAKDPYSHGHSLRVAEYSEKIARMYGKDEDECKKIYYAALLHDVGKIGIPISIINKKGKLTDEEYEVIKEHPVKGNQILSSISEYPYLSIGAHYHHERYDGKGYPDKLKGEDIPEIARIISVADAYDAMTSNRSYRSALPQDMVREEIVKGAGTQFDPKFAQIMRHLIDIDTEYHMKERNTVSELAGKNELKCSEHREEISDGIIITRQITKLHMTCKALKNGDETGRGPSLVLFDSLDGRYHDDDKTRKEFNYSEFCEIWFDGHVETRDVRKLQVKTLLNDSKKKKKKTKDGTEYEIESVKYSDHIQIRIDDGEKVIEVIIALSDSSRFTYMGLTGEYCLIKNVSIKKEEKIIKEDYITRIADRISYIDGEEGSIPNIQIDGHRTDTTEGLPLTDKLEITFNTKSLPTARLIWHCPFFVIYSSDDGSVRGTNYKEYALIRLDGENWDSEDMSENDLIVNTQENFDGWDAWKKHNKEGYECKVTFTKEGNEVTTITENFGIFIKNTTKILSNDKHVYVALTGDQCALTNIRIN